MSKIIRRVLAILPAILLQILWLYIHIKWLAPWSVVINFVLSILAFLLVLYHTVRFQHMGQCRKVLRLDTMPFPTFPPRRHSFVPWPAGSNREANSPWLTECPWKPSESTIRAGRSGFSERC